MKGSRRVSSYRKDKKRETRKNRKPRKMRKSRKHKKQGRKSRTRPINMYGGVTPKEQKKLDDLLETSIQQGNLKMIELLRDKGAKSDHLQYHMSHNHIQTAPGDDR